MRKETTMKYQLLAFVLCVFASFYTYGQIGEISFISGEVELIRDEEVLTENELTIGHEIENYDQILTASDGQLIINLTSARNPDAEIHIAPNTTFVIDVNRIRGNETTTLSLITGSLGLKVQKLGGNQRFHVQSEAATMGVRGTEFSVETSPAGDVLVTCSDGAVACRDEESRREIDARPGTVVEKRSDGDMVSIPVSLSGLRNFRKEWLAERISAFKPNALRVVRFYARRYDDLYNRFNAEYEALLLKTAILDKWTGEDREDRLGSRIQIMREKKQIIGYLFRIQRILFVFERVYHRLLELHRYFEEGYGEGEVKPGLSTSEFFRRFLNQRQDLSTKVRKVRYIMKLYAKRNEGSFPTSQF